MAYTRLYRYWENKNEEIEDFITHLLPQRIHYNMPYKNCNGNIIISQFTKDPSLPYINVKLVDKRKFKTLFNAYLRNSYYWRVRILNDISKIVKQYERCAKQQKKTEHFKRKISLAF
jgi:hypothetical protein